MKKLTSTPLGPAAPFLILFLALILFILVPTIILTNQSSLDETENALQQSSKTDINTYAKIIHNLDNHKYITINNNITSVQTTKKSSAKLWSYFDNPKKVVYRQSVQAGYPNTYSYSTKDRLYVQNAKKKCWVKTKATTYGPVSVTTPPLYLAPTSYNKIESITDNKLLLTYQNTKQGKLITNELTFDPKTFQLISGVGTEIRPTQILTILSTYSHNKVNMKANVSNLCK